MATYIVLANYTDEGMKIIDEMADRLEASTQMIEAMGAKLIASYWLMGRYDLAVIAEAPDDETVSRIALAVGKQGIARTETMRAFDAEEMMQLVEPLRG